LRLVVEVVKVVDVGVVVEESQAIDNNYNHYNFFNLSTNLLLLPPISLI